MKTTWDELMRYAPEQEIPLPSMQDGECARILNKTMGKIKETKQKPARPVRTVLIAAAVAALLCGSAFAAHSFGWFDRLFGEKAALVKDHVTSYDEKTSTELTQPAYTEEELALLIEKSWDHKLGLLIYITALLGLRRSEVLGLRWKAIDFEENRITINHTVTEARVDGKTVIIASDRTKTKSSYRSFPMSDTVREKLLAWREVQKRNRKICGNSYNMKDIDYVFTDEMGNRFKPRYIEDAFPKILERNGLRKIRFHDLRHTCASLMHKMGLSPKEVQDYLGHSTVSVTLNIYTHLDWSSKENAAKAMENAVKLPENVQIASKWES